VTSKVHRWLCYFVAPATVQKNEDGKWMTSVPEYTSERVQIVSIKCADCQGEASEVFGKPCLADKGNVPDEAWSGL
jgi:hypothetical protein